MDETIERIFLSAQACALGAAALATALGDPALGDALRPVSFLFGGAFLGARAYRRTRWKGVD